MQFIKWLGSFLSIEQENSEPSMQQMAYLKGVDRRRHARIKYPASGAAGKLPRVYYQGRELRVWDLSLGGLAIVDAGENFGFGVGQEIQLTLAWSDFEAAVPSRVVACTHERRHIQFLKVNTDVFVRLNIHFKPGYLGRKIRKLDVEENQSIAIAAEEMWLGINGEAVIFFKEENPYICEIRIFNQAFMVPEGSLPVYKDDYQDKHRGQKAPPALVEDMIVCLANIEGASKKIEKLIMQLIQNIKREESL